jgi:signal peptide peptidase SppA
MMKAVLKFLKGLTKKKKVVSVVRLKGVISPGIGGFSQAPSLSFETMKKDIDKAFAEPGLVAVALSINSPGGAAVQAELIHKYIRALSHQKQVPTYSFVEDVAASGGYWLACTSDEIYASENSIVGSIGVIAAGFGFTKAIQKLGIERRIIVQGKNKSIYDPFLPVKEVDVNIVKSIQKDIYASFMKLVIERRGPKLSKDLDKVFSGQFWSGKTGLSLGLIDGIGSLYEVMEAKYGKNIEYKFIAKEDSWLGRKLRGMFSSSSPVNEIINQVKERMEFEKFFL